MPVIPPVLRRRALQWSELCQRAATQAGHKHPLHKSRVCASACVFIFRSLVRGYKIHSFFKFPFLAESPAPKYKARTLRGGLRRDDERPIYSVYLYSG